MSTSIYLDELKKAQQRTRRFGLPCPEIPMACNRLSIPSNLARLPYVVGELDVKDVVAKCLSLHLRLRELLEQFFEVPVLYTIGYVYVPPHYLFKQTESELFKLMNKGITSPHQVNLHAWLTLPSMELLDFSLLTSLVILNGCAEGQGGIIFSHADELVNGLQYHPMLLGEEYLRRIGCLIDIQLFDI